MPTAIGVMESMEMKNMRTGRSRIHTIIGVTALVLLTAVFAAAVWKNRTAHTSGGKRTAFEGPVLKMETDELVYDGRGELNLMQGVRAVSQDGEDLTDKVTAVLTGDGNETNKIIRYTVFDKNGKETTRRRDLKLVGYSGPSIQVNDHLNLKAENMTNLTAFLKESGLLRGEDGFGKDTTEEITWMREKAAQGKYKITFYYTNAYQDSVEKTVDADVEGTLEDLTVTLKADNIQLAVGSEFIAEDYIEIISDPSGSGSRVSVTSSVDTLHAGNYEVRYTVVSTDNTQKVSQVLKVTVK